MSIVIFILYSVVTGWLLMVIGDRSKRYWGHDKASLRAGRRIHRPKSYKSDEFWFNNGFPIQVVLLLVWLAIMFHGLDWS